MKRYLNITAGVAVLLLFLLLPSGLPGAFDGGPLDTWAETWVVMALLPFLLILRPGFIGRRFSLFFLSGLVLAKLCLSMAAPVAGWQLWVYQSPEAMEKDSWTRTYESIWHKSSSAVLKRSLPSYHRFPVEWLNKVNAPEKPFLGLRFKGVARVPPGKRLVIESKGAVAGEIKAVAGDASRIKVPVLPLDSIDSTQEKGIYAGGDFGVEGRLIYRGRNANFLPYLMDQNGQKSELAKTTGLWINNRIKQYSDLELNLLKSINVIVQFGPLLWLIAFIYSVFQRLTKEKILGVITGLLASFCILGALVIPDPTWLGLQGSLGFFPLAVSLIITLALMFILSRRLGWDDMDSGGRWGLLFSICAPAILAASCWNWSQFIGNVEIYSQGNDWLTYQIFARNIYLNGDFLSGNGVWAYQPLYRYIVGFMHLMFGQSSVAQDMLDIWAVLAGAWLISFLSVKWRLDFRFYIVAVWLYFSITFLGGYRYHIGRGLQEFSAMAMMALTAYFCVNVMPHHWPKILAAGVTAMIAFWLRMDHLGILAAFAILFVKGDTGKLRPAWSNLLREAWEQRRWMTIFLCCLGLAVVLVTLRNWVAAGHFILNNPRNINVLSSNSILDGFESLMILLSSAEHGIKRSALVLWPGTAVGIVSLFWRPKPLQSYPISLGIALLALCVPYLFIYANNYLPRFSIHLLPLACLSAAIALQGIWKSVCGKGDMSHLSG
jgi:hypothetical protein